MYLQKTWTATEDSVSELETIQKALGQSSMSATLRYCIKQVFNQLKKEQNA